MIDDQPLLDYLLATIVFFTFLIIVLSSIFIMGNKQSYSKKDSENTQRSCPIVSSLDTLENYNECPVRTIGKCDKWRLGNGMLYVRGTIIKE